MSVCISSAHVHARLNFELVRLDQSSFLFNRVGPAAQVHLAAGLAPSDPRLTARVSIQLAFDRLDE